MGKYSTTMRFCHFVVPQGRDEPPRSSDWFPANFTAETRETPTFFMLKNLYGFQFFHGVKTHAGYGAPDNHDARTVA